LCGLKKFQCRGGVRKAHEDGHNSRKIFAIRTFPFYNPGMLLLLRHSYTTKKPDIIQGTDNTIELSDLGRVQAANVAVRLKPFNLEYIVSSDITRAQQTAEIVADVLNIPIKYDCRLNEYNYGTLTGHSAKELSPTTLQKFLVNPVDDFDAEPFESAFVRVGNFLESIDYDRNILAVTHSTILYLMMCYLENKTEFNVGSCWEKRRIYPTQNCDVFRIRNPESDMRILKNKYFCKMKRQRGS